jgi:adenylosuccinate lyase
VMQRLHTLLEALAGQIEAQADTLAMAFTHIQPAEPTTLGYRLAQYAQDLLLDWEALGRARRGLKGKGFKGAVGTGASYAELLGGADHLAEFEARLSMKIGLPFFTAATQVYPRKQDYFILSALAGLGGSLYKLAFDLRILQSPAFGELSEPFGKKQVGSSAMPFKRNPINAEKINSLARALAQMPRLAWDNAAHSLLERTLDDSANRRTLLPEAFLLSDELLLTATKIVKGLVIHQNSLQRNFATYGPFAASERVLMALGKAGADRQQMHEKLRDHAMLAWAEVQQGRPHNLIESLAADPDLLRYLPAAEIRALMDASQHLGDAPQRARQVAAAVRAALGEGSL